MVVSTGDTPKTELVVENVKYGALAIGGVGPVGKMPRP